MELSIIIPFYNADRYISECLDSVLACKLKEMECILVNDGSNDNSLNICQYYVEKDKRFHLIDRKNGGVSAARNTGIEAATGKYIMFLDADDYIDSTAWKDVSSCIEDITYDFVAYSYFTLNKNTSIKEVAFEIQGKECSDSSEIRRLLMASSCLNTCWGKLFKLEIILSNEIQFREDLNIGEDYIFVADYFQHCTSPVIKNMPILYFRQHAASAMRIYNLDSKLSSAEICFHYNKAIVLEYEDEALLREMYVYYLRNLTNLLLAFSKGCGMGKLVKEYREIMQRDSVREIVVKVSLSKLALYKKFEGLLLKRRWLMLMAGYYKLKSCLTPEQP